MSTAHTSNRCSTSRQLSLVQKPSPTWPERCLIGALLLLLAAAALREAIHLVSQVVWPVVGIAVALGMITVGWRWWISRGRW